MVVAHPPEVSWRVLGSPRITRRCNGPEPRYSFRRAKVAGARLRPLIGTTLSKARGRETTIRAQRFLPPPGTPTLFSFPPPEPGLFGFVLSVPPVSSVVL